jgi:hypothetical protein
MPDFEVGDLKAIIETEKGIDASGQKLIINGRQLNDDNRTLGDFGVQDGSKLVLFQTKTTKPAQPKPEPQKAPALQTLA